MMAGLSEEQREDAWAEIERELRQLECPDDFVGPCELLVGAASR